MGIDQTTIAAGEGMDNNLNHGDYATRTLHAVARVSAWQLLFYVSLLLTSVQWSRTHLKRAKVPGVGFGILPVLDSWVAAYRFTRDPVGLMKEGYAKYAPGYFRIATIQDEYVIVTDREKVTEYLRAPDDVLSMQEAANDQQQLEFTMGFGVAHRTYHTPIVRTKLTQGIKTHLVSMQDEVRTGLDDLIGSPADWTPFTIYRLMAMAIARTSNRVMISDGLHKDTNFLNTAIDYAEAVVLSAELIRPFPYWMKHIVIRLTPVWWQRRKATKFLEPILSKRLRGGFEQGEKPDDLLQWLIDAAPPFERNVPHMVERIMAMNVASIHTTTMTFTGALFKLAAEPCKYLPELRQELEQVLQGGPLTKERLNLLRKMDSFLREAARFNNNGLLSIQRNAKKSFTFSDGTIIPAGAKIGSPTLFAHRDAKIYQNPEQFDGFRFAHIRDETTDSTISASYQAISTAPELHTFGHGKHACPGRFFAVAEMKLIFAELIQRYDMSLRAGEAPKETLIATMAIPETKLQILFRVRR